MTDIRKFMNLMEDLAPSMDPARDQAGRVLHPDVSYDVSDSKVVATLKSYKSATYTRLAKNVEEMIRLKAEAEKYEKMVKDDAREAMADLFSAEDAARTRMVDTVSFIMQITKDPKAATTVKYAEVIKELADHLTPELNKVMEAIVAKHSKTNAPKPPAYSYEMKPKESVDLSEGAWDGIKAFFAKFLAKVQAWGTKYDQKLDALKAQVAMGESIDSLSTPAIAPMAETAEASPWAKFATAQVAEDEEEPAEELSLEEQLQRAFEAAVGDHVYHGTRSGKVVGQVPNKPESTIIQQDDGERVVVPTDGVSDKKPGLASRAMSWLVGEDAGIEEDSPYDKVGKDFQQGAQSPYDRAMYGDKKATNGPLDANMPAMISKWLTHEGTYVYIWSTAANGGKFVMLDGKGKTIPWHREPKTYTDAVNMLKQDYEYKQVAKDEQMSLEGVDEATNHMGEREYQTYGAWRAACRKVNATCTFDGDKDIGQAMVDGKAIGEWDGAVGCVYSAVNETELNEYTEEGDDAYPVVATLSDDELNQYAEHFALYGKMADATSESGLALIKFGHEVDAERAARGLI